MQVPITRKILTLENQKNSYGLEGFILLFEFVVGLGKWLLYLIQLIFDLLDFLLESSNFFLWLQQKTIVS